MWNESVQKRRRECRDLHAKSVLRFDAAQIWACVCASTRGIRDYQDYGRQLNISSYSSNAPESVYWVGHHFVNQIVLRCSKHIDSPVIKASFERQWSPGLFTLAHVDHSRTGSPCNTVGICRPLRIWFTPLQHDWMQWILAKLASSFWRMDLSSELSLLIQSTFATAPCSQWWFRRWPCPANWAKNQKVRTTQNSMLYQKKLGAQSAANLVAALFWTISHLISKMQTTWNDIITNIAIYTQTRTTIKSY